MLDVECFTYLNRALESPISPIVVLASNRGMAAIRGADDLVAAHGVPPDFLTRLLIIPTHPYDGDEIKRIVRIRATTEAVQITDAAIDKIAEHGVRISLRYCLQLLTPARYVSFCLGCPPGVCGERMRRERGLHADKSATTTASSRGSTAAARSTSRMSQSARTSSWTPAGARPCWRASLAGASSHNCVSLPPVPKQHAVGSVGLGGRRQGWRAEPVTFLIFCMYDRLRAQAGWENCVAGRSWRADPRFVVTRVCFGFLLPAFFCGELADGCCWLAARERALLQRTVDIPKPCPFQHTRPAGWVSSFSA